MGDVEGKAQDVSFKMSKKIAQLTKVIYQLNCRNEDNDSTVRSLAATYEDEISEIMVDARDKIKTLKDELDSRREEKKLQRIVEELTRQHNREKAEAMRLFDEFKNKSAQQEMTVKKGVDEKISKMTSELTTAKEGFKKHVDALEAKLADRTSSASDELAALRKAKEEEINNLVVTYNEKYKAMLAEQMAEQDKMEAALNAEWQAKLDALMASSGNNVSDLTKQLSEEQSKVRQMTNEITGLKKNVTELENLKQQNETEIFRLKQKLEQTTEALKVTQADLVESSDWVKNLTAKNDQLEANLKSEIAAHQTQMDENNRLTSTLAKREETITALENELAVLKQMNEQALAAGGSAADQVKSLNSTIAELNKKLASAEGHLSAAKEELDNTSKERDALQVKVDELSKALTKKEEAYIELEREKAAEIAQLKKDYEAKLEALNSNSNESQGALISQHQDALAKLRSDLEAQHDQLLEAKLKEWEKKLAAREAELRAEAAAEMATLKEQHDAQIADLKDKHLAELEALRSELAGSNSAASDEKKALMQQLADLKAEHEAAMSKLRADKDAELESLRSANSQLNDEVQTTLRVQIKDLEAKVASLEDELKKAKVVELDLKNTIEDGKKLLVKTKEEHEEALAKLRKDLEAEFAKRSQSDAASNASAVEQRLAALRAELEREKTMEVQRVTREKNDELATLKAQMEAAAEKHQAEINRLQSEIDSLKASGSASSEAHEAMVQKLRDEMAMAADDHRKSMSKMKEEYETKLKELEEKMTSELQSNKSSSADEIARLKAEHEAALTKIAEDARQAQKDMEEAHKNKLASLERRKDEERETKLKEIQERLSGEMQRANEQHSAEVEALNAARSQLDKENSILSSQRDELSKRAKNLDDTIAQLTRQLEDAAELAKKTEVNHRTELAAQRSLMEQNEREALASQKAQHDNAVDVLKNEHNDEKTKLKSQIKHLQRAVADLEYKYANRESRAEDVQKINQLMKSVKEREDALIKAHEDMKFYKLELVNREESYNKVFGRQPTVQAADENLPIASEPSGTKPAPSRPKHVDPPGVRRTKSIR